ncbi:spore germination protein KC [Paenibacillus forsythiae]|uniref:Spore germination protein KC n=1 Tax=Paenibacillus forsythiae TaxID=365616 RepID=A0ABU3H272_9BACL|nr:Ger(x)C family spore germination protein [Paenibacillus forsythiae]MDT3424919.1 spore germination protein KC [Paenibacillus forsythiae]
MTGPVTRRPGLALLCILLLCLPLSGCWDRRELNDLALAIGLGIDKTGDQYTLSAQVVIPAEIAAGQSSSGASPVTLYEATAPTVFEALRKMTVNSPRRVYLAHLRVLVLGERLAREGIADILDFFPREPRVRGNFNVMIAKDVSASRALQIMTPLQRIPANKLFDSLEISTGFYSPTSTVNMRKLIEQVIQIGKEPVLTGLVIEGNAEEGNSADNITKVKPSAQLAYKNLAVFHRDKLIGWLNEDEAKGYNYITGQIRNSVGHVKLDEGKALTETTDSRTKISVKERGGEPVIDVLVESTANLDDVSSPIDVTRPESIREIEQRTEEKLVRLMNAAVDVEKHRLQVDFLGFGAEIFHKKPRLWSKIRDEWKNRQFEDLEVHCRAKVHINLIGTSGRSVKQRMEEN